MPKTILNDDQLRMFVNIVGWIKQISDESEKNRDFDAMTKLFNQLYDSCEPDDFDLFAAIINDANESEYRSPK